MGCFLLSAHMDNYVPSRAIAGAFLINTGAGRVVMATTQGFLLLLALARMPGCDQIAGILRQPTNKLSPYEENREQNEEHADKYIIEKNMPVCSATTSRRSLPK